MAYWTLVPAPPVPLRLIGLKNLFGLLVGVGPRGVGSKGFGTRLDNIL